MKEGSKQVAKTESKSCLPRLVIRMPSSPTTVNRTPLLFEQHKDSYTIRFTTSYKDSGWLCREQERSNRGMTTNELQLDRQNPGRPPDRQTDINRKRTRDNGRGRDNDGMDTFA